MLIPVELHPMSGRQPVMLLFVVGMHRSGTSALCAALQAAGFSFGDTLLAAQAGVNEEGFWEDADVVALNDALLFAVNSTWYTPDDSLGEVDWSAGQFSHHRRAAIDILQRGFGGSQAAVKDPRFCLTLPFWLACCAEIGTSARVCVIGRAPIEIARSLEKRDGFPLGYGLRLVAAYKRGLESNIPPGTPRTTFDELLADPAAALAVIELDVSNPSSDADVKGALRSGLRHHKVAPNGDVLSNPISGESDLLRLEQALEERYSSGTTLRDFARALTTQSAKLTGIGEAHEAALATLDQRDADIEALSAEHKQALATIAERDQQIAELDQRLAQAGSELEVAMATIEERDEQIAEFDRRLSKLGEEHAYALEVLRERDAQLERLRTAPGMGLAVRWMLSNEKS